MPTEVGKVVSGKVTGITKFGAFIELETGETGLCHISEIANEYVENVDQFLKKDDEVQVKILNVDKGKINLSIKQATAPTKPASREESTPKKPQREYREPREPREARPQREYKESRPQREYREDRNFQNRQENPKDFENMLTSFMKNSDEKLRTVKKAAKGNRRGNSHNKKK